MTTSCRVELLGELRVRHHDTETTRFRTQKTAALLAFLAIHLNRSHAREELIERFWPDTDLEAGRTSLRTALSALRQQLESSGTSDSNILLADRQVIRLNADIVTTDVRDFEAALTRASRVTDPGARINALMEAVGLYRGPLLPGFYEDWAIQERERLETVRLRALRDLVTALEQSGEPDRAIEYARQIVHSDPLMEEAHADLMRLYAATGQTAALTRQYRELERVLRREMNDEPGDEIKALYQRLLRERPAPVVTPRSVSLAPALHSSETLQSPPLEPEALPAAPVPALPPPVLLPNSLTRFFGRDEEISRLCALIVGNNGKQKSGEDTSSGQTVPLVTLIGSGGSGKTRLAVEAARHIAEETDYAVYFVPLQDITDAELIPGAVLQALQLPPASDRPPLEQLCDALSRRSTLLILDNFEQLVEAGAPIVQELLERTPTLRCIVTSRQRLDIGGEAEFPVQPLPVPNLPGSPQSLAEFASVRLFLDRAQAARPGFQITRENAAAIAALCERLEGIPLAIELAAAWAQTLTPAQMLTRLSQRFDLLTSRRRDLPTRHRTLRSAIEWSYQSLPTELQEFFSKLSLFRGGWSLEAAEQVCAEPMALDYLAQLRERSLLVAEDSGPEMRYRLLETLREYADELLSAEVRPELERRHTEFYLQLAEQGEELMYSALHQEWCERLDREQENFRAVLARAQRQEDTDTGLRLIGALTLYWEVRGENAEGLRHIAAYTIEDERLPLLLRARALCSYGILREPQGNLEEAYHTLESSLKLYRELGYKREIGFVLRRMTDVAYYRRFDKLRIMSVLEEAKQICEELRDALGMADTLAHIAGVIRDIGDVPKALSLYDKSLALYRQEESDYGVAHILRETGYMHTQMDEFDRAREILQEALDITRRMGNRPATAHNLWLLGRAQLMQGDVTAGDATLQQCIALAQEIGVRQLVINSWSDIGINRKNRREFAEAAGYFRLALEASRETRSSASLLWPLWQYAEVLLLLNEPAPAAPLAQESVVRSQETGNIQGALYGVELLCQALLQLHKTAQGVRLFAGITAARETLELPALSEVRPHAVQIVQEAESALGSAAFQTAWEAGRSLTIDALFTLASEALSP